MEKENSLVIPNVSTLQDLLWLTHCLVVGNFRAMTIFWNRGSELLVVLKMKGLTTHESKFCSKNIENKGKGLFTQVTARKFTSVFLVTNKKHQSTAEVFLAQILAFPFEMLLSRWYGCNVWKWFDRFHKEILEVLVESKVEIRVKMPTNVMHFCEEVLLFFLRNSLKPRFDLIFLQLAFPLGKGKKRRA